MEIFSPAFSLFLNRHLENIRNINTYTPKPKRNRFLQITKYILAIIIYQHGPIKRHLLLHLQNCHYIPLQNVPIVLARLPLHFGL